MPLIQSQIVPINPNPLTQPYATHEDIYGKGGYVAITTTQLKPLINDHIIQQRRKVGMMVYDTTENKFYTCDDVIGTSGTDDNWSLVQFNGTDGVSALSELSDVSLSSPLLNNQVLVYNASDNLWKNRDLVSHFGLITEIGSNFGIDVSETTNGTINLSLNATIGNLSNVADSADDVGNVADYFLKWNPNQQQWEPSLVKIVVDGNTDGTFAQYNEPFVTFMDATNNLPNSLTLEGLLNPGYGIKIESQTNYNLEFSLDQDIVVLYEDMPQYTDGTLDVARQSSLLQLLDILNSFGTTECPFGGGDGGILTINAGLGIIVATQPNRSVVVSINDAIVATTNNTLNLTNKTYNGLSIQDNSNVLELEYPSLNVSLNILSGSNLIFQGNNVESRTILFSNRDDVFSTASLSVAYEQDLFLSKLQDIEIVETDLQDGNLLSYDSSTSKWTNTNIIFGGRADSF